MTTEKFPIDLFKELATPFYAYDMALLDRTIEAVKGSAPEPAFKVKYALKANPNRLIAERMSAAGFGADCVSGGEIELAIACGFTPGSITYAGVGKTDAEIELGLKAGIGCFNVESVEELEVIGEIAASMGKVAPVALRVNPDIDAHTHHYITTGIAENKFGISLERLDEAVELACNTPSVKLRGLHFHIGSQVLDMKPFVLLSERINSLIEHFARLGVDFETINVGGGLGIDYDDPDANPTAPFADYFNAFRNNLKLRQGQELHFELGRSMVAQCGSLIAKVLYVKRGVGKDFVIVDAGMTDLIRPALYGAVHKIENITSDSPETAVYDVVGPVCESSDTFATAQTLRLTRRGDLIAIRSAGAYGEAMASTYNCRALPRTVAFGNQEPL